VAKSSIIELRIYAAGEDGVNLVKQEDKSRSRKSDTAIALRTWKVPHAQPYDVDKHGCLESSLQRGPGFMAVEVAGRGLTDAQS